METIAVKILDVMLAWGQGAGMNFLLSMVIVAAFGWMLWKISPALESIARIQQTIAISQEATAVSLKQAADAITSAFSQLAEHDRRAALIEQNQEMMHDTCRDHGEQIGTIKDFFTNCHKEEMLAIQDSRSESLQAMARIEGKIA